MSGTPLLPSSGEDVERRRRFIINFVYWGILVVLLFLAVKYLLAWMLPFVLAFVVAAILQKPLRWLVKVTRGGKKFFSVALVVVVILLLGGIALLLGWRLVITISAFVADSSHIDSIQSTILSFSNTLQDTVKNFSANLSAEAVGSVTKAIDSLSTSSISLLTKGFTSAATWALGVTAKLPQLLISFIVWVIASIFCTIDYDRIVAFFFRQIPDRYQDLATTTRALFTNTIFKMLRAYLLLMLITFTELSIGLLLLRVDYAIPLAALIAVVDILPVLGTGTIVIPWAVVMLIMGNIPMFFGLSIMYIIITVVRNILEPRLVSQQIGLNPLVTLFFMFLGLRTIGIFGMFLFPMAVIVLKRLHDEGKISLWK